MKSSFMLVGIIMVYIVIGFIAQETGLTEPLIDISPPESPTSGGSFLEKLTAAIAPLVWAFNAVASLLQLAAYQGEGIPPLVNTLILAPLGLVLTITVIKLVRGVSG